MGRHPRQRNLQRWQAWPWEKPKTYWLRSRRRCQHLPRNQGVQLRKWRDLRPLLTLFVQLAMVAGSRTWSQIFLTLCPMRFRRFRLTTSWGSFLTQRKEAMKMRCLQLMRWRRRLQVSWKLPAGRLKRMRLPLLLFRRRACSVEKPRGLAGSILILIYWQCIGSVFLVRSIATLLEGQDLLRGKSNLDLTAGDGDDDVLHGSSMLLWWSVFGCLVHVMVVHSMFDFMSRWFCSCHVALWHVMVVLFMSWGFISCLGGFVHAMWLYDMSWWFCSCHVGFSHVMVVLFMSWGFISCHGGFVHATWVYYMSWFYWSRHDDLLYVMVFIFMSWSFVTCHGGFVHAMVVYYMSWWFCSCHVGLLHVTVVLFRGQYSGSKYTNESTNKPKSKQTTN